MDQPLTAEHFRPYVGKVFRVKGGSHELTLSAVDAHNVNDTAATLTHRQPFTLIFCGPPRDVLREGMYTFDVADGIRFDIYTMPVLTPVATRQDYQAAFN
jgi:hypothetical protein